MYYLEKPQAILEIPEDGHCAIEASAGTGKTYMIKKLFFDLLLKKRNGRYCYEPGDFLVVTFTREATAELRRRLQEQLKEVLHEINEIKKNNRPAEIEPAQIDRYWHIDDQDVSKIHQALMHFNDVQISTLDSITQRILRDNKDITQMHADAQVLMNYSTHRAFNKFMRNVLPNDPLLHALAFVCKKYEKTLDEPLRENAYDRSEYLKTCLDNTLKFSCDMVTPFAIQNRPFISSKYPCGFEKAKDFFSQYISWCQIIKEQLENKDANDIYNILKTLTHDFIEQCDRKKDNRSFNHDFENDNLAIDIFCAYIQNDIQYTWLNIAEEFYKPETKKALSINQEISKKIHPDLKSDKVNTLKKLIQNADSPLTKAFYSIILYSFPKEYFISQYAIYNYRKCVDEDKSALCQFSIEDFTKKLQISLTDGQTTNDALIHNIQDHWKVAIIDEFQDTSEEQWDIIRTAFFYGPCRIFIIGDPKQAIYGFRGCDVFIYREAKREILQSPGGKLISLAQNFRSSKAIIQKLNDLYLHINDSFQPGDSAPNTPALHASCQISPPTLEDGITESSQKKKKNTPSKDKAEILFDESARLFCDESILDDDDRIDGREKLNLYEAVTSGRPERSCHEPGKPDIPIQILEVETEKDLSIEIVGTIKALQSPNGARIYNDKDGTSRPIEKIYILAPERKYFNELRTELTKAGMPFFFKDKISNPFLLPENLDLLRIMRAIETPNDDPCIAAALNTLFFGMSVGEVHDAMASTESRMRDCFKRWAAMSNLISNYHKIFDEILNVTQFKARLKIFAYTQEPFNNVSVMMERLLEEALIHERSWTELIQWFLEMAQDETCEENPDSTTKTSLPIQLLTMHSCKGLEADAVFLLVPPKITNQDSGVFHQKKGTQWIRQLCPSNSQSQDKAKLESMLEDERLIYVAMTRAAFRLYLPLYPAPQNIKKWDAYQNLQSVLRRAQAKHILPNAPTSQTLNANAPSHISQDQYLQLIQNSLAMRQSDGPQKNDAQPDIRFSQFCRQNFSYSKLKQQTASQNNTFALTKKCTPENIYKNLPKGTHTGLFLHELLEKIDFNAVSRMKARGWNAENWFLQNDSDANLANATFEQIQRKYQTFHDEALIDAKILVFRVLTAAYDDIFPENCSLCNADAHISEMDFLSTSDAIEGIDPALYRKGIDMFNGAIDCCARIRGRWYLIDWKSDTLPKYDSATLKQHVQDAYDYQYHIYMSVFKQWLARMAPDETFAGMLYIFLRGITGTKQMGYCHIPED